MIFASSSSVGFKRAGILSTQGLPSAPAFPTVPLSGRSSDARVTHSVRIASWGGSSFTPNGGSRSLPSLPIRAGPGKSGAPGGSPPSDSGKGSSEGLLSGKAPQPKGPAASSSGAADALKGLSAVEKSAAADAFFKSGELLGSFLGPVILTQAAGQSLSACNLEPCRVLGCMWGNQHASS